MKNQEYLADDCKKDKELFNSSYYFIPDYAIEKVHS